MENKYVRYGIAGFGLHAVKRFIPAFKWTQQSELVAIHKRNYQEVMDKKNEYDIQFGFTDVKELVNAFDVDAVIVASPPFLHKEQVLLAAEAGKHVMVEKPMATSAEECKEMITACRENNVKLFAGFCMRFTTTIQKIRDIIHSGRLGEIYSVDSIFTYDASMSPRKWLKDPRVSGGGPVADLASHKLDILEYLLEQPIVEMKSIISPPKTADSIEQRAVMAFRFKNNTLGRMITSFDLPREKSLIFAGTKAKLSVRDFTEAGDTVTIVIEEGQNIEKIQFVNENHFAQMIDSFSESILMDLPPLVPGEAGLANQLLIDEIYQQGA